MSSRAPLGGGFGGLSGLSGAPPRDVVVLLVVVFGTFSLQFFDATAGVIGWLRLTPAVLAGFVWQLATYAFVGFGAPSLWFLLELLILYWFAKDVFWRLGRRRFWQMVLVAAVAGAVVATVVLALSLSFGGVAPGSLQLIQGQRVLLAIVIAAFATLYGEATILLFFVLPIRARWFVWLEVLFAFMGYLGTKDLPGFLGICTAVMVTVVQLRRGGPRRLYRDTRLQLERWIVERRLARLRRRRDFKVVDRDRDPSRWIN